MFEQKWAPRLATNPVKPIVELPGTTHMRVMADKEREIAQAMKSFARRKP